MALLAAPARADPQLDAIAGEIARRHVDAPDPAAMPRSNWRALADWLTGFDRWSALLTPAERARQGQRSPGLGGLMSPTDAGLLFVPFQAGPAAQAGLTRPLWLDRINTTPVAAAQPVVVSRLLASGPSLRLIGRDAATDERRAAVVTTGAYDLPPLESWSTRAGDFLRIHSFVKDGTFPALAKAVADRPEGRPLVIDLRYATGGDLLEAVKSASLFLPLAVPVLATEGAAGNRLDFTSLPAFRRAAGPAYLLIGPHTASAAEVFARALQTYGAGILVGAPTFGKCLIQKQFDLAGGGALRLSVARMLGPGGMPCAPLSADVPVAADRLDDTAGLLDLVARLDWHRLRLVCVARPFRNADAWSAAAARLGWDSGRPGWAVIQERPDGRRHLCLGPPRPADLAQDLAGRLAEASGEAMAVRPVTP